MQSSAGASAPASWQSRFVSGYSLLALLSLGHTFIDLYSGALGVLQPFLIRKLGLSLTQAGILGGTLILSSSVVQPLYGYLSDRFRSPYFTTLAPALAGLSICSLSLAPGYGWALACVLARWRGHSSLPPPGQRMGSRWRPQRAWQVDGHLHQLRYPWHRNGSRLL